MTVCTADQWNWSAEIGTVYIHIDPEQVKYLANQLKERKHSSKPDAIILRKCVVQPVFVTSLAGVSVCLRYMTDAVQPTFPLFTLSPDTSSLSLQRSFDTFMLSYYDSFSVDLQPIVHLWPDIKQDIWTSVCLTVDTSKNVVQMFSGGYMSPRKVMPYQVRMSTKLESAC